MNDYIERAAVEKFIEDGLNNPDKNKAFGHDAIEVMAEIHYMPAADVAPVRHGRWILLDKNESGVCSECNRQDHIDPLATHCRYCGALMDGKEDGYGRKSN